MKKTTLVFYPNQSKKSIKNGRIPFYLRLLHNGGKAETRLNFDVDEADIKLWNPMTSLMNEKDSIINRRINALKVKFEKFEILHNFNTRQFSAKDIVNYLVDKNISQETNPRALLFVQK